MKFKFLENIKARLKYLEEAVEYLEWANNHKKFMYAPKSKFFGPQVTEKQLMIEELQEDIKGLKVIYRDNIQRIHNLEDEANPDIEVIHCKETNQKTYVRLSDNSSGFEWRNDNMIGWNAGNTCQLMVGGIVEKLKRKKK